MSDGDFGAARYDYWTKQGLSRTRKDGSIITRENDIESAEAEAFAVRSLGAQFQDTLLGSGDGGQDCIIELYDDEGYCAAYKVQVKWMGRTPDGEVRRKGNLLVKRDEPQRFAPIYVSVGGGSDVGFWLNGWTTHEELVARGTKNFGYGEDYYCPLGDLRHMQELRFLQEERW